MVIKINSNDNLVDFPKIEKRWQKKWGESEIFEVKENKDKKKFYALEMYPYPSGSGLHMGHAFNYSVADIFARFKIMNGYNVLHPAGYDSFGLPAENAAIQAKSHPKKFTDDAIKNFIKQQKALGLSYDWSRILFSHDPEYYKWNQFWFLKFYEKGLVYRKKSPVNWCSKCNSVLANEQVHNGKCWRHKETSVEIKQLDQWFLKTTDYADELLDKVKGLDWPERIKIMQENWIGRSYGAEINFEIPTNANFVLLHGFTGSPQSNFFPWLKKELEYKGYKVDVPELPDTNNPNIMKQIDYVLKNCKFDENTIILGHSLGSVVALKVVERLNKPIKKLILAAGLIEPNSKDKSYVKTFDWKYNFDKIKNNINEIIILKDVNDKEVRKDAAIKIKSAIGGNIIEFEAEDEHICGKIEPIVLNSCLNKWPVFTTRSDTLFGVTFLVVSAQHPKLNELITKDQKKEVDSFLKKIKSTSLKETDDLEKEGAFTGSYAIHPLTNEKIPIWTGNFVVADYGSGMVMAVPAHDQRDFEFAKKYKIPIKLVINPIDRKLEVEKMKEAFIENGILINSEGFNDLESEEGKEHIIKSLEFNKLGNKKVQYKLRDWLVSRQRYWGTPIPVVYCDRCGIVPVEEKDLPITLPDKVTFGDGNPLLGNKEFVEANCPKCGKKGKRETDTMDTFFDSSWYFLRFCDSKNKKEAFEKKKVDYWMPVDFYIGGAEHACMHLIYARFFTKVLRDLGYVKFDEPFIRLFNQGMIHGEDGFVMSKSRGNVIDPLEISNKYGADTLRLFLVSVASPDKDFDWSTNGLESNWKFLRRIWDYFENVKVGKSSLKTEHKINLAIKKITNEIEILKYNNSVIVLRDLFDSLDYEISREDLEKVIKLIAPFIPHIAEEIWEKNKFKGFVSIADWPKYDDNKINEDFEKAEKSLEKTVSDILNVLKIIKDKEGNEGDKVYLYVMPFEVQNYDSIELSKRIGKEIKVFAVNDKKKYDPENKSSKAKPGRPALFIE